MTDDTTPLFAEFDPASYEAWVTATVESLKGKPFDKLISQTYEGIKLPPMLRQEDVAELDHPHTLPGQFPFVRGRSTLGYVAEPWAIAQELPYGTPQAFNAALRHDLMRGQTAVNLLLDRPTRAGLDPDRAAAGDVGRGGVSIAGANDLLSALDGVDLSAVPLFVRTGTAVLPILALLAVAVRRAGQDVTVLHGSLEADPLGELARRGTLPTSLEQAYDELALAVRWAAEHAPHLALITIHGYPYHNAGGSAVDELAFVLATAVATVRALQARGLPFETIAAHMQLAFSVGGDFFMEIAKLRAARLLWSQVAAAFGGGAAAQAISIQARTARWNKTLVDPYVNMLRVTTEAFAAAVGGVQSMHTAPFDEEARPPDEFSRRIARNVQIVLQEEANLARLIDPAGGSWTVEYLTDQVARAAWGLFQAVERQGGMLDGLHAGLPQNQVAQTDAARTQNLATRRDVLVGTNMYVNLDEERPSPDETDYQALFNTRAAHVSARRAQHVADWHLNPDAITVDALIAAAEAGATLGQLTDALRAEAGVPPEVPPVDWHRAAEPFEQLRTQATLYAARTGHRPRIFLANMGPLRQHKARADFTRGFFEIGGFEIIYPNGFDTPQNAAQAALASGAPAVVICSTDDTYPEIVPPLVEMIRAEAEETAVILAGYPRDQIEAHKSAGIDEFIYLGADCLALNRWLQDHIGAGRRRDDL